MIFAAHKSLTSQRNKATTHNRSKESRFTNVFNDPSEQSKFQINLTTKSQWTKGILGTNVQKTLKEYVQEQKLSG